MGKGLKAYWQSFIKARRQRRKGSSYVKVLVPGYGHIVPTTKEGKIVTIFYAIFGMQLFLFLGLLLAFALLLCPVLTLRLIILLPCRMRDFMEHII